MDSKSLQNDRPAEPPASQAIDDQAGPVSRAPRFEPIQFGPAELIATGSRAAAPNYLGTSASTYFAEKYSETFVSVGNEFVSSVSLGFTGHLGMLWLGPGLYVGSAVSFGLNAKLDMVVQFQTVYGVGLGTYAGGGIGFQMGTGSPAVEGWQSGVQVELNAGWGQTWGGQIQLSDGGWGFSSSLASLVSSLSARAGGLRDGVGYGAHISIGRTNTRTFIIRSSEWSTNMRGRSVHSEQLRLREWSHSARK